MCIRDRLYDIFNKMRREGLLGIEKDIDDPAASPIFSKHTGIAKIHGATDFIIDYLRVMTLGGVAAHDLDALFDAELETHQSIDVERMTLAGLLDRWLEATFGEMRVATRNSYKSIRRLHVDPALGGVLAAGLTRTQLSAYYSAKMRGNGKPPLAETTVAHHHSMIKAAFNWTIDEEQLAANPAQRVKNPPALRPRVRPVWSMEEIAHVVVRARGLQVHAAGVLAALSGPRAWEDEDKTVLE